MPFVFLCFLKLLLPRVHTSEGNLIQVDSVLVSVQFKVIFLGSQQHITQSLWVIEPLYQHLISNYFSAHTSLKIWDMMTYYTSRAEAIMKGSSLKNFLPEREWRGEHLSYWATLCRSSLLPQKLNIHVFLGSDTRKVYIYCFCLCICIHANP